MPATYQEVNDIYREAVQHLFNEAKKLRSIARQVDTPHDVRDNASGRAGLLADAAQKLDVWTEGN